MPYCKNYLPFADLSNRFNHDSEASGEIIEKDNGGDAETSSA